MNRAGFSMIELIVALTLSALVLAGIMSLSTAMFQFGSQQRLVTDAAGWEALGTDQLARDVEQATYINTSILPGDALAGCRNYSATLGGRVDTNTCVDAFLYCVAEDYPAGSGTNALLRYPGVICLVCPLAVPVPCENSPLLPFAKIVAKNVSHIPGYANYFYKASDLNRAAGSNALAVKLAIGKTAPTAAQPLPKTVKVDAVYFWSKSYQNTGD